MFADVTLNPDPNALPGGQTLQTMANGAAAFALIVVVIALVVGAAFWAVGRHSGNYRYAETGKMATFCAMFAAVLIGGAAGIINFFYHAGGSIH